MLVCMKKKEAPSAGSRTPRPIWRNRCVSQALLELNATPGSYQLPLGYGGRIYPELCGALNLFTLNNSSRLAPEDIRATWPSASRGDSGRALAPDPTTSGALGKPSSVHHLVLGMPSGFAASAEDPKQ
jgi:hypothetical protein